MMLTLAYRTSIIYTALIRHHASKLKWGNLTEALQLDVGTQLAVSHLLWIHRKLLMVNICFTGDAKRVHKITQLVISQIHRESVKM